MRENATGSAPAAYADVRLENVVKRFDDTVAVDGLSLEIPHGSFFALLGPSGCGKTTTLRMIGGFEQPTAGRIFLGDQEVEGLPPYKRDVNTVFQSYALFPHLSLRTVQSHAPTTSRPTDSSAQRGSPTSQANCLLVHSDEGGTKAATWRGVAALRHLS